MTTSTVTTKGQITMPAYLRKELNIKPADKVVFNKEGSRVYVEKVEDVDSLFGSLANPKVKPLTISQMNKMVEKGMFSEDDIA